MSLIRNAPASLSGNDKVIHYLQTSTNNSLKMLGKSSPNNLFSFDEDRFRSSSENVSLSSSSSSILDSLPRSDLSAESSVSDPAAHSSSLSSIEDLDFNIGFEQISDDENKTNNQLTLDEYFHQSSNSTILNDDYDNDDTITVNYTTPYGSFLHDSTYTLCPSDRFSAYREDNEEDDQITDFAIRSNSLNVRQLDDNSTFLEIPSKKAVHFADMLGLDLVSIRYMTPPDQTTTSIIQECVRLQLSQMRFSKNQLDISKTYRRSPSTSFSYPSPTKQYNLISKNFTSPINIIPLIYTKQVLLECLYTKDSIAYGTIRVHNCAYDKRVFIRLTDNEWLTSNDIPAWHSMSYPTDNTDTFAFEISLTKSIDDLTGPKRILFGICLQAMSQEFWDNNQGWNYVLDVYERR